MYKCIVKCENDIMKNLYRNKMSIKNPFLQDKIINTKILSFFFVVVDVILSIYMVSKRIILYLFIKFFHYKYFPFENHHHHQFENDILYSIIM